MIKHTKDFVKFLFAGIIVFVSAFNLLAQGKFMQAVEVNRNLVENDAEFALPFLSITPITDLSSGTMSIFQPAQIETLAPAIQAVPEPSILALLGLVIAGIAILSFCNQEKQDFDWRLGIFQHCHRSRRFFRYFRVFSKLAS